MSKAQQEFVKDFDMACGHFEAVAAKGGKIRARGVRDIAIVAFTDVAAPDSQEQFIHCPRLKTYFIYPERRWVWRRVFEAGCHLIDGNIMIGGNQDPDHNGVGGLWTVVGVYPHAKPDLAARFTLGHTMALSMVPEEMKAVPEGRYKDVSAPPESMLSLFSAAEKLKRSNRKLRNDVHALLQAVGELVKRGEGGESTRLRAPVAWTRQARGDVLELRFLSRDMEALERINDEVSTRAKTGSWPLPLRTESGTLRSPIAGTVDSISENGLTIVIRDVDGGAASFHAPAERSLIDFFDEMTGHTPRSMQLHPLVQEGDVVRAGDELFGPIDIGPTNFEQLMQEYPPAQLHTARLWAAMSMSIDHQGQTLYPVSVVTPASVDDCYMQVAGPDWSARLQRILLEMHVSKVVAHGSPGLFIDGYYCSHRAVNEVYARRRAAERKVDNDEDAASQ